MCGIFGHIGAISSIEKCIEGLRILEYRGYDSAGIAGIEEGKLICYREKGKIADLEKLLHNKIHNFQSSIGHTRWATHGSPSAHNAHPQLDQKGEIAVVHNGIIENHRTLKAMLEREGVVFSSDTDTEIIAQLISYFYEGDLIKSVRRATSLMKGFWSLAILHKNHPGQIVATRCENPLVVGISKEEKEAFVSSDPYAFQNRKLDLYFLENHQIALIEQTKVTVFDVADQQIEAIPEHITFEEVDVSKGKFPHFMLKEIFEQPLSIASSIHGRFLLEEGDAYFESFPPLQSFKELLILGCGTSWHAGLIAAQQFEELAGIHARAEIASEFRYRQTKTSKETLVIVLSQSGETFDTIGAMRKAKSEGAKVLAICNVQTATLMREADYCITLRAGPEICVCSTKAFTSQLAVLSLIALKMGQSVDAKSRKDFLQKILNLPLLVQEVLDLKEEIAKVAREIAEKSQFLFLGRQYMYPTCLEAALKLKEISYKSATGYPAGELKHGPIALIDSESVVIALMGNKRTYDKMVSNLEEVKARGGYLVAFAPKGEKEIGQVADRVIFLPDTVDSLSPLPYAVATQLLSYEIALCLGREIDQPRNLAKSVTVE